MDSPEALVAVESLRDRIFKNGQQKKNVPAAILNKYNDLRKFLSAQGEDVDEYPPINAPEQSEALQGARRADPGLAWDTKVRR